MGRPRLTLVLALFLTAAGLFGALRLDTSADVETLVDSGSAEFEATERFKRQFGDDAVVVLVKGDLLRLLLTVPGDEQGFRDSDLVRLLTLEGCLSGNAPKTALPRGPCRDIAELRPSKVVYGPGTFINEAVTQLTAEVGRRGEQARQDARRAAKRAEAEARRQGLPPEEVLRAAATAAAAVLQKYQGDLLRTAVNFGITAAPGLDNPGFVSQLVFDSRRPAGTPKARFAYLFPNRGSALVSVRLRPDLSAAERERAIGLFREAVESDRFALRGAEYVLSGVPVVVEGVAATLKDSLALLLAVALAVMAATLAAVFGPPLRLLPLGVALAAAALAFGGLSAVGGELTMASIAVLPILIGLGVDYAIQFQARFREALAGGLDPPEAALVAARRGAPVIGTAGLATAAGFCALLLSPVPMVRGFGVLLVAGIALAFVAALTVGFAALALSGSGGGVKIRWPSRLRLRRLRLRVGLPARWLAALRSRLAAGLSRLAAPRARLAMRAQEGVNLTLGAALERPRRVLAVALTLAVAGWVADTSTEVVSDFRELVPRELPAIRDVDELQNVTGVSGELNVVVTAPELTDPAVIGWMSSFQRRVLERNGFGGEFPSCERARVCPAISLPDLFRNPSGEQTRERVSALLDAVPPYFSQAVISGDRRTANIAFGIRAMPLDEQQRLIEDIREQIDPAGAKNDPPPGVEASLAGLPVLAAEANEALADSRYWLALAGLAFVALVLLAVYRSLWRALVPLVPIALATGWSALVLAAMEIPLNPMSATLGALVIAIATEFSVILSARYAEERAGGLSAGDALRRTYERTGRAVFASGATAIAGFAALIASDIRMLRDFGFVTVVDLGVALLGVMLVLPAVLVWAEQRRGSPIR